jgi:hypothetical protein
MSRVGGSLVVCMSAAEHAVIERARTIYDAIQRVRVCEFRSTDGRTGQRRHRR